MRAANRGWRHAVVAAIAAAASAHAATDHASHGLDPELSGADIYAKVLENRFDAFVQESSLASGDRAGRIQKTRFLMHFRDFRDGEDAPDGVLSKTLVKYTHPFDLRHAGYLVIQNEARLNDQFVYLPTRRQTVRVNLRGKAVFGTDFSFEDVIPRELEDATYHRLDDGEIDGRPVYVVEARPTESYDSEYSKLVFFVEDEHFVPLRTRYWDEAGVEVKEMSASREALEKFGDVWVPMKVTMRHLLLDSFTVLEIESLTPEDLPESLFEVWRLESH